MPSDVLDAGTKPPADAEEDHGFDGRLSIDLWPAGACTKSNCFNRNFVIPCKRSQPAGQFTLDGITNDRMDLVARCITAAFMISFGIRHNTDVRFPMTNRQETLTRTIHINGANVKHLRPDERGICALLHRRLTNPLASGVKPKKKRQPKLPPTPAQIADEEAKQQRAMRCLQGIAVYDHGFRNSVIGAITNTLEGKDEQGNEVTAKAGAPPGLVLVLDESAPLIDDPQAGWKHLVHGGVTVVLGDNRGVSESEEAVLHELDESGVAKVVKVSLGPVPLLASQCIMLVHHYLDRLVHTCNMKNLGSKTPASLRGQQCKSAEDYDGWQKSDS